VVSVGSRFTFFLGADVLDDGDRFSSLGPMLMLERPTSLGSVGIGGSVLE
jgi:hypothetical protein